MRPMLRGGLAPGTARKLLRKFSTSLKNVARNSLLSGMPTRTPPLAEVQRSRDALVAIEPIVRREVGPSGAAELTESGGVFGVTTFDDSTYR